MNVFDLFAKLSLDTSEYEKGLKGAKKEADSFGSKVLGGLGSAGKAAATATVAAVGAAATGIAALTKEAVSSYAEYEQLVGGVETLFGSSYETIDEYAKGIGASVEFAAGTWEDYQNRQQQVLDNANRAYETAGMSANEYMETVTSFAASLNSSLGQYAWQSANYADLAIQDMSDNANKMGTSMESIQNAYQGFAKQNYTMLDNLKLGYGGTQKEMNRLLRDAEKLEGYAEGHLNAANFADVIEAIHIIQDNLGITGTTAAEASKTISGSISTVQAAWQNLVTGFANKDADIGQLIENLIVPATNVLNNMLPVVEQALTGIGTFIEKALPAIMERVPVLLNDTLPSLISAAINALKVIVDALVNNASLLAEGVSSLITQLIKGIAEMAPKLIEAAVVIVTTLATGLADALPELVPAVVQAVLTIVQTLFDHQTEIMLAAIALIQGLVEGILNAQPILIQSLPKIIESMIKALIQLAPNLLIAAIEIITQLAVGLVQNIGILIAEIPSIIQAIINGFVSGSADLKNVGKKYIQSLKDGIEKYFPGLINSVSDLGSKIWAYIADIGIKIIEYFENLPEYFTAFFSEIINSLTNFYDKAVALFSDPYELGKKIGEMIGTPLRAIYDFLENLGQYMSELPERVWQWLNETIQAVAVWSEQTIAKGYETALAFVTAVGQYISELPGRIWQWLNETIQAVVNWGVELYNRGIEAVTNWLNAVGDVLRTLPSKMKEIGIEIVNGVWNGIQSGAKEFTSNVKSFFKGIVDGVKDSLGIHSPSRVFASIGDYMVQGLGEGWEKSIDSVKQRIGSDLDFSSNISVSKNVQGGTATISQPLNNASTSTAERDIIIPVYIGSENIDTIIVNAQRRIAYRSGGMVYA